MASDSNQGQVDFWNADPGRNWVRFQPEMDLVMAGVADLLLLAADPAPGESAIDIGCGAGATTLAVARRVGPQGRVIGVDISEPLLARAEERRRESGLEQTSFLLADAQDHAFSRGMADLILSRFGVMFFADPVAAFRNLGAALRPGGRMVMATWAEVEANPFFLVPGRIAAARLGPPELSDPDAPGPMAFRNTARVTGILRDAGLAEARADRHNVDLHHPGGIEAVVTLLTSIGAIPRLMRDKGGTAADMAAIQDGLREAFSGYATPDGVRIPAVINLYSATRG